MHLMTTLRAPACLPLATLFGQQPTLVCALVLTQSSEELCVGAVRGGWEQFTSLQSEGIHDVQNFLHRTTNSLKHWSTYFVCAGALCLNGLWSDGVHRDDDHETTISHLQVHLSSLSSYNVAFLSILPSGPLNYAHILLQKFTKPVRVHWRCALTNLQFLVLIVQDSYRRLHRQKFQHPSQYQCNQQ